MPPAEPPYIATLFQFELRPDESISERIVRCCTDALGAGAMGQRARREFYRDFIACNQERSRAEADALATVRTSCALFVRAVRRWCGGPGGGPYVPGTAMFASMGKVSFRHAAFVDSAAALEPNPGDYFYISSSQQSNDGHTGIFVEQIEPGIWRTAEGGGGDGTECAFRQRSIVGQKFGNDRRKLWGWFDCTKVGLPPSPEAAPPPINVV